MDNDLIDRSLAELQKLPHDQRTPEQLQIWLSFICEAGGIEIGQPTSLQHEHLKLEAAVVLLSQQLGATSHSASLRMSSVAGHRLLASLYVNNEPNHQAYGHGQTAVEAMAALRAELSKIGKEAA